MTAPLDSNGQPLRHVIDGLGNTWRHYHDIGWVRLICMSGGAIPDLAEVDRLHGPLRPLSIGHDALDFAAKAPRV
jgi:hypothetical protein